MNNTLNEQPAAATGLSNKEKAMAILNCLETRDQVGPGYISDERYIQHNLVITDNKPGFMALQNWLPEGNKVEIIRAFEDCNYVFIHAGYNLGGPMVGMDIFRFENGKAVEHWDNLQLTGSEAAFETMTSGPVMAKDLGKTVANKALVKDYVQKILVDSHLDKEMNFINPENYLEHQQEQGSVKYHKIHLVLGEGDFCMAQSEGQLVGKPVGLYDLFRVENAKIVEHWHTVEAIPERSDWQNENGKF